MTDEPDNALRDRHERRLSSFILRARRVEAHSLAQDLEALAGFANAIFEMSAAPDGTTFAVTRVPTEETLESAAARIRPLLLDTDHAHALSALKSLGYLMRNVEADGVEVARKFFAAQWRGFNPKGTATRGYNVQTMNAATGERTAPISDNELAFAWIYGDVVHADEKRLTPTRPLGVKERYRAAVPLVCQVIGVTLETLHFLRTLRQNGHLTLPDNVWKAPVIFPGTELRERAVFHVAEISLRDGEPPIIGELLGPEWSRFTGEDSLPDTEPDETK